MAVKGLICRSPPPRSRGSVDRFGEDIVRQSSTLYKFVLLLTTDNLSSWFHEVQRINTFFYVACTNFFFCLSITLYTVYH